MAEQSGRWVTVRGAHVFIKDGETPDFSKNRGLQKTVKEENKHDPEYKRLEDDINNIMKKDIDEGTFLHMRARIIEELRKAKDPAKYDVLLGKFERYAKDRLGYTDEDMEKMAYQGTHVKLGTLQKYNAHPMGSGFDERFTKLKDQVNMAKRQQNGKMAQSMFSKATQMYDSLKESDLSAEQRKKLAEYMEKHTYR